MSGRERLERCPFCGGGLDELFRQTDFVYKTTDESFPYARCRGCGLVMASERPAPSDMARYYPPEYSFFRSGRAEWLKDALKAALYAAADPGRPALRPSRLFAPLIPVARRRGWMNALRGYREPSYVPPRGARVLDVGCGSGTTFHPFGRRLSLAWLKRRGVDAHGVDPSPVACAQARKAGLDLVLGDFLSVPMPPGRFDVVRFNHSLEHVHDPAGYLQRAAEVLKPGGRLVVSVPNYDGATYGLVPEAVEAPRHLFYFNPASLRRRLEADGFVVESVVTPPTPEVMLYVLERFAPEAVAGLPRGREVLALLPGCRALAALGRGDDLDVVARRPA